MRELLLPPPAQPDLDPLTIDQHEAARLTRLSAKTLGRLADAGEPVGRVKIGRRVLYHRATLSAWLSARAAGEAPSADSTPAPAPTTGRGAIPRHAPEDGRADH